MTTPPPDGSRRLSLDDPPVPAQTLRELAEYAGDTAADRYMEGELFERLQGQVAMLLGKEAALYLPSGKLAQMAALKVLTGRAGCRRIALHPRAHLEEYEARAYQELWGLTGAQLGGYDRLPTISDLEAIQEPLGAMVLEIPVRRLGCLLPTWDELSEISELARKRSIFRHMDGARLWESQPFYGRPLTEIAGLFDTVYVAFDKGLGGLCGAALAGPQWVIDEVKIWQRRAGGRALRSFPNLLSAAKGLEERLPRMTEFHHKACSLAEAVAALPGVGVSPRPPHANAFMISLPGRKEKLEEARNRVAREIGLWLFDEPLDCVDQSLVGFEVTVRMAAFRLEDKEVREAVGLFSRYVNT